MKHVHETQVKAGNKNYEIVSLFSWLQGSILHKCLPAMKCEYEQNTIKYSADSNTFAQESIVLKKLKQDLQIILLKH